MITIGNDQYYQTIITDKNATGDPSLPDFATNSLAFKQETLVKRNSEGVASNSNIADASQGRFSNNAAVRTGWAHGDPLDPTLEINQSVATPATNPLLESSTMWDTFYLVQGETDADKIIDINASVGQNTPIQVYTINVPIMFRTNIIQGAFQNTTHDALIDPVLLPSSGGNIDWLPGEAIQATWVGASYTTTDPFVGLHKLGATSYTNLTTGESTRFVSMRPRLSDPVAHPNPDSWVSPFLPPTPVWVNSIPVP